MQIKASKTQPPVGALITIEVVKDALPIKITWDKETSIDIGDGVVLTTNSSIARFLARSVPPKGLYASDVQGRTEIDHWLTFTMGPLSCEDEFASALDYLNSVLGEGRKFLVDNKLSVADYVVFGALYTNGSWTSIMDSNKAPDVLTWFNYISSLPEVKAILSAIPSEGKPKAMPLPVADKGETNKVRKVAGSGKAETSKQNKDEGKFVDLPGAEMGKVVVRFPPEASGYLHIGHAKAALLNQHYQQHFEGKLIMRFDDTNPAKEKEEYEQVILEDLKLLKVKYDHFSRTSDHFDTILAYCEKMIKEGKAYVDDTDAETMKKGREVRQESKNRNNTVEQNWALWQEMKKGTEVGQKCAVRPKMNMQSDNGCMRDPTIYRCKNEKHPATGNKFKVYPTYDFACPIVDSIEGVTHSLRTTEYMDRDEQFNWFIQALGLRKPYIYAYARLNLTNTLMSKRKLTWFVDEGRVDGWEDPRFPTVRGIIRRGLTVEALKQFIVAQGSSRSVVFMEWDKIWAMNKKIVDPVAPRYTAVDKASAIPVHVTGDVRIESVEADKHPKDKSVGQKTVWRSPTVLIDEVDAETLKEGENATFINWGNLTIEKINRENGKITSVNAQTDLGNSDFKKTVKLTWLAKIPDATKAEFTPTYCIYYDHIITKQVLEPNDDFKDFLGQNTKVEIEMLGDPGLRSLSKGDIIQLQRRGYFIVDTPYKSPSVHTCKPCAIRLIAIPDGTPDSYGPPGKKGTKSPGTTQYLQAKKLEKRGKGAARSENSARKPSNENQQTNADAINESIAQKGNHVRQLKSEKADKVAIDAAVQELLRLKANYKEIVGKEWKPDSHVKSVTNAVAVPKTSENTGQLDLDIIQQGNKVRDLKSKKAEKAVVDDAIAVLLELKAKFKDASGIDWKPSNNAGSTVNTNTKQDKKKKSPSPQKETSEEPHESLTGLGAELNNDIISKGNEVRKLKADKADEQAIKTAIDVLLGLKDKFKKVTGQEWKQQGSGKGGNVEQQKQQKAGTGGGKDKGKGKKQEKDKSNSSDQGRLCAVVEGGAAGGGPQKQTRLCIEAKKAENLPEWYSQVIVKAEMLEYYDVSGCYILRPWAFSIWERIQSFFDGEIKKLGVENCYFPIFVSKAALQKEKDHIADFAPEVAWVTKSGDSDLAEHVAIRPTSETVMYPAYAKWIQSYRDLPLKLNQWNNIVRWEFKHPQPFLRTREFLWQEGHTAFATFKEAEEEVLTILDLYRQIYEDILAIPVIRGRKTEKEKFAGGDFTTTTEAYIAAAGRAIQGATSHHLGQNFSKMFNIVFEDHGEKKYVYQNSWGITTRTLGVLVMVHGDDKGMVLPPNAAAIQVVIVPCGITASLAEEDRKALLGACEDYEQNFKAAGIRTKGDYRENYSPGWKFNHWELKGVPIRVELGPRDVKASQFISVRRDTGEKIKMSKESCGIEIQTLLNNIQSSLFARARKEMDDHLSVVEKWDDFVKALDNSHIIQAPFCGKEDCEDQIKDLSKADVEVEPGAPSMGAKSLCIPFHQPKKLQEHQKCVRTECKNEAMFYTLFGRSY